MTAPDPLVVQAQLLDAQRGRLIREGVDPFVLARARNPEPDRVLTADEIRAAVDEVHPRALPGGEINAAHVAMESTLREWNRVADYVPHLDGPGRFLPHFSARRVWMIVYPDVIHDGEPEGGAIVTNLNDALTLAAWGARTLRTRARVSLA